MSTYKSVDPPVSSNSKGPLTFASKIKQKMSETFPGLKSSEPMAISPDRSRHIPVAKKVSGDYASSVPSPHWDSSLHMPSLHGLTPMLPTGMLPPGFSVSDIHNEESIVHSNQYEDDDDIAVKGEGEIYMPFVPF